jgi:hypothetical protein
MKSLFTIVLCLFIFGSLVAKQEKKLVIGEQPVFKVHKARGSIIVDGVRNDPGWENAEIRSLDYFYRGDRAPDKQKSTFRMLWDEGYIYLFYDCEDTSLTARETIPDSRPYLDDCAEFFCLPVPDSLNLHFGFEINLYKAAFDYVIIMNFYNDRYAFIKSYNPAYKAELSYQGTINDNADKDKGWQMEIAIPFSAFNDLNSFLPAKVGTRWAFQAVRQDRNVISESRRSTSTLFPIYDIRKDVHQPSRFGLMEFVE